MKKIFLFLAMAGMAAFTTGCSNDDDIDRDTISEVFERSGVNFQLDPLDGRYFALVPLDPPIYNSDVILVYRRNVDGNAIVWSPVPQTIFLGGTSEVNYDFNFTTNDVQLILDGTIDIGTAPEFRLNQTFRIVIVPGYFANTIDTSDYNAVMSALEQKGGDVHVKTIEN